MKAPFILACIMIIGCENKPAPTVIIVPAPKPTTAPTVSAKVEPCANAKSDEGCDKDPESCVFTTDDGHCVISKKKPILTKKELDRLNAEIAAEDRANAARKAEQQKLCSGKNIMNTCCSKACSGEQSIQKCLASFYRKGCDAVDGMNITCGCIE